MANDVKWVKLTTDMFDNRKIKHLRRLPDGNNIVLIWVMLLTMAGRCNSNGMIFLTENIPYTPKMLADELDFEENTVILALQALENLDMIMTDGKFFSIAGWEEYQNVEGMDKIREQNRLRKQRQRANQKLLEGVSRDSHGTVTECHAIDVEKEQEKDLDNFTTTTTEAAPTLTEVYIYFRSCIDENYISEAEKFHAYNAKRGWDCLPNWKATADLWIARIDEKG
jgi:predicted phage replisome organizer